MADYTITQVEIDGVPVRVSDRIAFTFNGDRLAATVEPDRGSQHEPHP